MAVIVGRLEAEARERGVQERQGKSVAMSSSSVRLRNIGTGSGSTGISPSGSGASMPSTCQRA